jgi:HPt (histidine-containing phosphotransfer) domain-containing protein
MDIAINDIFDVKLSLQALGGKLNFIKEILSMFFELLPQHKKEIKGAMKTKNDESLLRAVHQFHGAVCYCGMPRLKAAIYHLEEALRLKKKPEDVTTLYQGLLQEIDLIEKAYLNSKLVVTPKNKTKSKTTTSTPKTTTKKVDTKKSSLKKKKKSKT